MNATVIRTETGPHTDPLPRAGEGVGARFVNVGERTNVTGSARFKKLVLAGTGTLLSSGRPRLKPDRATVSA